MANEDFLGLYLDEAEETIEKLASLWLKLEQNPDARELLNEAFRLTHTLKGSSAVMDYEWVSRASHLLEAIFDKMRNGAQEADKKLANAVFAAFDSLRDFHGELRRTKNKPRGEEATLLQLEEILAGQESPALAPRQRSVPSHIHNLVFKLEEGTPFPDLKGQIILSRLGQRGKVLSCEPPLETIEKQEFPCRFKVQVSSACAPEELLLLAQVDGIAYSHQEDFPPGGNQPPELKPISTVDLVRQDPLKQDGKIHPARSRRLEGAQGTSNTIRISVEKLDQLMVLAGEMTVQKSRLEDLLTGLAHLLEIAWGKGELSPEMKKKKDQGRKTLDHLWEVCDRFRRTSAEVQRSVLGARMVPVGPLFSRWERAVRDLSQVTGKEINFHASGENVEIDKRMIEELFEPVLHLLRNAADHGLEPAIDRLRLGKTPCGKIQVDVWHQGNSVAIEVSDDGKGIGVDRIREKLLSLPEYAPLASSFNDDQLLDFLWQPGFSTRQDVSDLSGRGFGLDIVRTRINRLNGSTSVSSEIGKGTSFQIRLPLTLAILPCMLATIGNTSFSIPLESVKETTRMPREKFHKVERAWVMELRGQYIPVAPLDFVLGDALEPTFPFNQIGNTALVVVITSGREIAALPVDGLMGRREIVIKSLEENYAPVQGLAGASILGDGTVSLLVDIDSFLRLARKKETKV